MKIGPFLVEIWSKTSRKASRLGVKRGGGALIGGGALKVIVNLQNPGRRDTLKMHFQQHV